MKQRLAGDLGVDRRRVPAHVGDKFGRVLPAAARERSARNWVRLINRAVALPSCCLLPSLQTYDADLAAYEHHAEPGLDQQPDDGPPRTSGDARRIDLPAGTGVRRLTPHYSTLSGVRLPTGVCGGDEAAASSAGRATCSRAPTAQLLKCLLMSLGIASAGCSGGRCTGGRLEIDQVPTCRSAPVPAAAMPHCTDTGTAPPELAASQVYRRIFLPRRSFCRTGCGRDALFVVCGLNGSGCQARLLASSAASPQARRPCALA